MSKGQRQQPIPQPRHKAQANRAWDELNSLSTETTGVLSTSMGAVQHLIEATKDPDSVSDMDERNRLVTMIGRDAKSLTDRVVKLREEHAGRKGNALNPDDLTLTLNIGMKYADIISDTEQTLIPAAARLTELTLQKESPEPVSATSNTEA